MMRKNDAPNSFFKYSRFAFLFLGLLLLIGIFVIARFYPETKGFLTYSVIVYACLVAVFGVAEYICRKK